MEFILFIFNAYKSVLLFPVVSVDFDGQEITFLKGWHLALYLILGAF